MALTKIKLERVFMHNDIELSDIDENMTAEQVQEFYSNQYPEIINASISGPIAKNDKLVYSFETNIGKKG